MAAAGDARALLELQRARAHACAALARVNSTHGVMPRQLPATNTDRKHVYHELDAIYAEAIAASHTEHVAALRCIRMLEDEVKRRFCGGRASGASGDGDDGFAHDERGQKAAKRLRRSKEAEDAASSAMEDAFEDELEEMYELGESVLGNCPDEEGEDDEDDDEQRGVKGLPDDTEVLGEEGEEGNEYDEADEFEDEVGAGAGPRVSYAATLGGKGGASPEADGEDEEEDDEEDGGAGVDVGGEIEAPAIGYDAGRAGESDLLPDVEDGAV